jgi:plasmid stability protein
MANISIRRLDDDVVRRLRIRAAQHGVSMEEEARQILTAAVAVPPRLGELASSLFGPEHGVDLEAPDRPPHSPPTLDD